MSAPDLHSLLPIVYRQRDELQGGPLRALMLVLQRATDRIAAQNEQLYADWFVQTAQLDRIALVASILQADLPDDDEHLYPALRAYAQHLATRRRTKGTLGSILGSVSDATGWSVSGTVWTSVAARDQSVRAAHLDAPAMTDVRKATGNRSEDLLQQHFACRVDLRAAAQHWDGPPEVQPASLLLDVFRLAPFAVERTPVRPLDGHVASFDPFGLARPLFSRPSAGDRQQFDFGAHAISRQELAMALIDGGGDLYGPGTGLCLFVDRGGETQPIPAEQIRVARLAPGASTDALLGSGELVVAIDPETGRLAHGQHAPDTRLLADWTFGASRALGWGPSAVTNVAPDDTRHLLLVGRSGPQTEGVSGWASVAAYQTLREALSAAMLPSTDGARRHLVVRIGDSEVYPLGEAPLALVLRGCSLVIEARPGETPTLRGDLDLSGVAEGSNVVLRGLAFDGHIALRGSLAVHVDRCTVLPTQPPTWPRGSQTAVVDTRARLDLRVTDSVIFSLRGTRDQCHVAVHDSVVLPPSLARDETELPGSAAAMATLGCGASTSVAISGIDEPAPLCVERCTVLGGVEAATLAARDTLFDGLVRAQDTFRHALHNTWASADSVVPRRTDCPPPGTPRPRFNSTQYGAPGFAQLAWSNGDALLRGGTDGLEIGVFHDLKQPLRLDRLEQILTADVPAGLTPQVHFST